MRGRIVWGAAEKYIYFQFSFYKLATRNTIAIIFRIYLLAIFVQKRIWLLIYLGLNQKYGHSSYHGEQCGMKHKFIFKKFQADSMITWCLSQGKKYE